MRWGAIAPVIMKVTRHASRIFLRNLTSKYVQFGRQKGTAILFSANIDWGAGLWHGGVQRAVLEPPMLSNGMTVDVFARVSSLDKSLASKLPCPLTAR